MRENFDPNLKANLTLDESDHVRGINHLDEFWAAESNNPRQAAIEYLRHVGDVLALPPEQLEHLHQQVSYLNPADRGADFRLSEEKQQFDSTTAAFYQTYLDVPVWGAGLTVTVKHSPARVVSAVNTSQQNIKATLPSDAVIERWRAIFRQAAAARQEIDAQASNSGFAASDRPPSETAPFVEDLMRGQAFKSGRRAKAATNRAEAGASRLIRGRFFVYRYDPDQRLPGVLKSETPPKDEPKDEPGFVGGDADSPLQGGLPTLQLPPVDKRIQPGGDYLVAEITFENRTDEWGDMTWLALVELETSSILYLRALSANAVHGLVYLHDPITETGTATNTPDKSNAVLDPFQDDVVLPNLNAPSAGTQSLAGSRVTLSDIEILTLAPPTKPSGTNFDFQTRTNGFAAVNAYYHVDRFFALVEDLGFTLATYFNGTTFPVPVDHRGKGTAANMGNTINAHCVGNGTDGIGHLCFALADLGDTANPIGIATDWRVHLHELGGHGVLEDHVNSPNFGFAHSAGDSVATITSDPESQAPDRFVLAPFVPAVARRVDRLPAAGWGWGGVKDTAMTNSAIDGGYPSEEILATTMFRLYRSIGGDSTNLSRRKFAARSAVYLIFRAIGTLAPMANAATSVAFANALMAVDLLNWTSEGVFGGAYGKVIRWAFEKQGLYQAPGAPTPIITPGAPPVVDVYIDDGRAGEYPFQPVHWNTTAIWNRNASDGMAAHQAPILGQANYAYVKIKNRGSLIATNVVVKGFHSKPMAGLLWPTDFQAFTTAQVSAGTLLPNNTEEKTVGPFEWTPVINGLGHDCILMIASATSDPSNIDNYTVGEVIPEWRLVPNDNNIGQRNVQPVPGGGNLQGLLDGLNGFSFWVGNPNPGRGVIDVAVKLPPILEERNWKLSFRGLDSNRFTLPYGKQRELVIDLTPGGGFERADVEAATERDIEINVHADGGLIGGMTYRLDPTMDRAVNRPGDRPGGADSRLCRIHAKRLLECLDLHGQSVKSVEVTKVTVEITMEGDC